MSQLRQLIEARRRNRGSENEARDAQGRWTAENQSNGRAIAQSGLRNLIKRTKIRQALRQDAADKIPKKEPPIEILVPRQRTIIGDRNTSKDELKSIGILEHNSNYVRLSSEQLDHLHLVRNGFDNLQEFLNAPPKLDDNNTLGIYAGDRVKMLISYGGSVCFNVDGTYNANEVKSNKPSQELREMTRAWLRYLKSKASDRVLFNNPYDELSDFNRSYHKPGMKNMHESRIKMYRKYGFSEPVLDSIKMKVMVLDNRKDKTQPLPNSTRNILGADAIKALGIS